MVSLLLPSLLIMFIPSTFKRPVSSWKALNLRKTLLMASSVRLKPLNCSRLPCVYAQETLTFLLTQKKTCVKNYVRSEERFSRNAETDLVCRLLLEKKKKDALTLEITCAARWRYRQFAAVAFAASEWRLLSHTTARS